MRGKFIVFEGIDGCGKGTQIGLAVPYIFGLNKSIDLLVTREPTRDFSQIREKMKRGENVSDDREWYAQQFTADRINHCEKYITPALENGTHVLCDRYYHSTLAYQSTQGMNIRDLIKIQRSAGILIPDLTLIFDCTADVAFERRKKGGATDVFDNNLSFQERLSRGYSELSSYLPEEGIEIINANRTPEEIFEDVKKTLTTLFNPNI